MADLRAPLTSPAGSPGEPAADLDVEAMNADANSFGKLLRQASRGSEGERRKGLSMEWRGLSFSVGDKQILKDVTGVLFPGRLTAVLGPSGSGKSTLLNVLAGRQRTTGPTGSAPMTGEVSVGGTAIDVADFKSSIAYVMQDDRSELVGTMLSTLGLNKCADTIVGSALLKGISGGERKRTSVGVELITDPKMFFLDEPLSGLDSFAAYTLVQALKDLALAGVPVLCTVHQPSSEIFAMFDDVIILHDGEVVYHGPVAEFAPHFSRWGKCPANFNPADHVMFLIQKDPDENSTRLREMKDAWLSSDLHGSLCSRIDALRSGGSTPTSALRAAAPRGLPLWRQLAVLTSREFRGTVRNKGILGARFGMSIFLALLYAWLFAGSARNGDDPNVLSSCVPSHFSPPACASDFQAHYGTLVSLSISSMMGSAQPILLSFPSERPVFLREYASQQYSVLPYFVAKTLVEMPVVFISNLMTYLFSYWIMGLQGNFLELTVIGWALGITSSSLALVIGCGVASGEKAIQLAPLALIPQMLFSGLFLPVSKIPTSLQWVKYLCPLKYAINLATMAEFHYIKESMDDCEIHHPQQVCRGLYPGNYLRQDLIENQGVQWSDWVLDVAILTGLFVTFRTISLILLWRKGKYVF
ncbi:unnamed protein product [Prorocentrum cordatum]|uniref:ABC transporter domain-containing protein n=1 Tax=Prorocentrum cordatum TaxID=2364126 RepID=A0ABN9XW63_9DINO|nr:unnamed protein product [Polarella glacialis]